MLIGLSDFKTQVEKSYYVDKTGIIDELAERLDTSTGIIINRPRRFGKSLMLSMLDAFFSDRYDNADLFNGLSIAKSKNMALRNTLPVINLSFKDSSGIPPEKMIPSFMNTIASLYRSFQNEVASFLDDHEKKYFDRIIDSSASREDYMKSLNSLCTFVQRAKGKKAIILVDEYDAPIERVFDSGDFQDVVDFLKGFFVASFKDVSNFSFALLTGVFSINKGTLGSGLNNLPVDSAISRALKRNYFGFTDEEVMRLCADFHVPSTEIENIRNYYGGYIFSGEKVCNPWSVLNYIDSLQYATYWNASGSNATFVEALNKNEILTQESLLVLLQSGKRVHLDPSSSYDTIYTSEANLILYLVMAGYFTVRPMDFANYFVYPPNLETKYAFMEQIRRKYKDKDGLSHLDEIRNCFLYGDEERLSYHIKSLLLSSLSYYDFGNEKSYQIMIGTLLALAFSDCVCRYEVISGTGRCDIMLRNKTKGQFGAVIEIKYHSTPISMTRLNASAERALNQILTQEYHDELLSSEANPIYAYGFAFMKNKVAVKSKRIR